MNNDVQTLSRLIRHRRSVYPVQYSGEPVRREIIEEMLGNANWAPTHKLTEPWRFVVFSGDGLKKLADFMSELYREVSTRRGNYEQKTFDNLSGKPLLASHVIAIGMARDPKERLPEVEEIEAVACAVQNMYLTASAYGVGCYWGSGGITYFEEARAFFGLGPADRLLGFLYVGMPKEGKWPSSRRRPLEEKVRWVED